MATPFAPFANARILWRRPAVPNDFRSGTRPASTTSYVVEAFIEPQAAAAVAPLTDASLMSGESRAVTGYLCRWAELPDGAEWLDAGTGWTWDTTGLRPPGLTAGQAELKAALVAVSLLPAIDRAEIGTIKFTQVGSPYGPGGIGNEITRVAGEYFAGLFRAR